MARSLASASTQYLYYDGAIRTVTPLTACLWAYPLQTNAACNLFSVSDHDTTAGRFQVYLNSSAKAGIGIQNDGGGSSQFTSTVNSYSANQWCHVGAVFASNASRTIYLNADTANKGTGTTSVVPDSGMSRTAIGALMHSNAAQDTHNGYLAHVAVWGAALSDADMVRLYNNGIGVDPRSVRPDALVAYWPLLNDDGDQDYWGNYHLTASGSPTYAQHPPVLMRSRPKYVILGSAAPTVGEVTITGTRTIGETITANATPTPGDATLTYQWEKSSTGVGAGTDISGETASTLALTYADFGDILDTAAYVRCGVVATKDAVPSVETFSSWLEVSAGGAASVGSPFVSSSIR